MTQKQVEATFSASTLNRLAYSRADERSWMEQGPNINASLRSFPVMRFLMVCRCSSIRASWLAAAGSFSCSFSGAMIGIPTRSQIVVLLTRKLFKFLRNFKELFFGLHDSHAEFFDEVGGSFLDKLGVAKLGTDGLLHCDQFFLLFDKADFLFLFKLGREREDEFK